MLVENKIQLEAIKTRNYLCGEKDGIVLVTDGRFIVYIKNEDFLLDLKKQKEIPTKGIEQFIPKNVKPKMREATISKRMVCQGTKYYRAVKDKETGQYAWFDVKYMNLFQDCSVFLVKEKQNSEMYDAVFTRYGEIVGYVLPIRHEGEWE